MFNIDPNKNYKRADGLVFTGKQILNLLKLADATLQAIILLSIVETDEKPLYPKTKYGYKDM